jgi:hypothetical protein
MSKKQFLILQAGIYSALAVVILIVLLTGVHDKLGFILGIPILSLMAYRAFLCIKHLKTVREEDRAFAPATDASVTEQVAYYKMLLLLSIPTFAVLSAWSYKSLHKLEIGTAQSVKVWAPISFLYEVGGFWLAVLTTPIVGIMVILSLWKKFREIKNDSY